MKKISYGIIAFFLMLGGFLTGFLIRQPKINKMKKKIEQLQNDNSKLIEMITAMKQNYRELLIQHKSLKALQFRKKTEFKERMKENLVMQYAIKEYLTLLMKSGRYDKKLEKNKILFFEAFEKVIDGKKLSTSNKVEIRDYIIKQHGREIKQSKECEYTDIMTELQNKPTMTN